MELFIKACGAVLMAVILILTLGKCGKDLAMILGIAVCCIVFICALGFLRPVMDFVNQLENLGGLDHAMIRILLKAVGISLISEFAALVCNDSGCSSLGKAVKLMGSAVILWLSLPLYSTMIELLQRILGGI